MGFGTGFTKSSCYLIKIKLSEQFLYEPSAGCPELEAGQQTAHVSVEAEVSEEIRTFPVQLDQASLGDLGLEIYIFRF